jgi:hypothetical protein
MVQKSTLMLAEVSFWRRKGANAPSYRKAGNVRCWAVMCLYISCVAGNDAAMYGSMMFGNFAPSLAPFPARSMAN